MPAKGHLLIGYDVEKIGACQEFITKVVDIHEEYNAPLSLFTLGSCLAGEPELFASVALNPLVDVGQHTWSHILLKTIVIEDEGRTEVVKSASNDEIEYEITRSVQAVESICQTSCFGLSAPWMYYRGLADRPDLLEILHRAGIRYIRSYGRNERDWQPVRPNVQPFWYEHQGYPDVLECMAHGWQDACLRSRLGWGKTEEFIRYMMADLADASENGRVFSWCCQDWSALREDPALSIVRAILQHARALGMEILNYRQFWMRQDALRLKTAASGNAAA